MAITQLSSASDLTTEMVRSWIGCMQERLVPCTVSSNLKLIKAILNVGVAEGLLEANVASTLSVTFEAVEGYQPFTKAEVLNILEYTVDKPIAYQRWLPRLGLYTGARIEEISQLRTQEIHKENDVCFANILHDLDA